MQNSNITEIVPRPNLSEESKDLGTFVGQVGMPGEGPHMTMTVRLEGDTVREAHYETYGCPAAFACGKWLTEWVVGKSVTQARVVEVDDLVRLLKVPLGKEHTAQLAVGSLRDALSHWQNQQ